MAGDKTDWLDRDDTVLSAASRPIAMLGLRYVACEACGRVTATPGDDTVVVCGRCESEAVRDLPDGDADGAVSYFASSMRGD